MAPGSAMRTFMVVPTYNEAENLPELLRRLFALEVSDLHVLVVDDASPDGTGELANRLAAEYGGRLHMLHRPGKQGLASAYQEGYQRVLGLGAEAVAQMDADLSHPPEYLPTLLAPIYQDTADLVIASRYVPGGGTDPRWSLGRKLLSRGGNFYARLVTGMPLRDATSGFRCFRRGVLEEVALKGPLRCKGFGFQVEVAYICWRRGHRIQEVPFRFSERGNGQSKITPAIVLEALLRLPQMRWARDPKERPRRL